MIRVTRARGGLYLWRTRKPHAVFGLPFIGRHNGYGGMSNSYARRESEHLFGTSRYEKPRPAASWSDLEPKCYRVLPLPDSWFRSDFGRRVVLMLETILIALTCPVYNERQQAPWNVRRISRARAARMRAERDRPGRPAVVLRLVVRWVIYVSVIALAISIWRWVR